LRRKDPDAADDVAALVFPKLCYVLPFFFVGFLLFLAPRRPRGEVDRLGVARPGKGVNFFVAAGYGKGFASTE
jgi:hypothetical protein